jgi:hypothetical protein
MIFLQQNIILWSVSRKTNKLLKTQWIRNYFMTNDDAIVVGPQSSLWPLTLNIQQGSQLPWSEKTWFDPKILENFIMSER